MSLISAKELFFEIKSNEAFIRLEPLNFQYPDSNDVWDKSWVHTKITLNAGPFTGQYMAESTTRFFGNLKNELVYLYNNFGANAICKDYDGYLNLSIVGDGLGHFDIEVTANSKPGIDSVTLRFFMQIDQTKIPALIQQLESIEIKFPVLGKL